MNERPYIGRTIYSQEQKDLFIETAKTEGVSLAIKSLGYPTWNTAMNWCKDLELPKSLPQVLARLTADTYTAEERLAVVKQIMDKCSMLLHEDGLDAINLKRVAETLKIANETHNLIEGKATNIAQTNGAIDNSYIDLIKQMEAKNAAINKSMTK